MNFAKRFNLLKPYIYVVRTANANAEIHLKRLKEFEVQLCFEASGTAKLPTGAVVPLMLEEPGEQIIHDTSAYLVVSQEDRLPSLTNPLIADTIGEILAAVLGIERGSDFARLVSCGRHHRDYLLAKIIGVTLQEAQMSVYRAREKLETDEEEDETEDTSKVYADPSSRVQPVPSEQNGQSSQPTSSGSLPEAGLEDAASSSTVSEETVSPPDGVGAENGSGNTTSGGAVTARQKAHIPAPPPKKVGERIRATPVNYSLEFRTIPV